MDSRVCLILVVLNVLLNGTVLVNGKDIAIQSVVVESVTIYAIRWLLRS